VLIAAIYVLDIGVTGVFWINFGMSIFGCLVGLWYIRDWLVVPSDFKVLKPLLPYALPLGVIMLVTAVLPVVERLFVEDTIGPDALGYYAAGAKVAMLISIPIAAFNTAWGPFSLAIAKEPDAEQTYQAIFRLLVVMVVPLVLVLDIMGSQILNLLAGSGYTAGSVVVFPLACGIAIGFLGSVSSVGLAIRKRMIFRLYAFIFFLVAGFVAIIILGNLFGLQGVAYGTLIGQLVLATSLYLFAKMISGISWNIKPVLAFSGVFLAGGFALNITFGPSHIVYAMLHAGAVLVVCPLVGLLLFFTPAERRSALAFVRRTRH
ncbi:MAG: oligosaccharide flippase family protein, partial [Planctomycetota bacterium]|nr:oligosaccharide flippase family protein [Planctomycetota bacterium]